MHFKIQKLKYAPWNERQDGTVQYSTVPVAISQSLTSLYLYKNGDYWVPLQNVTPQNVTPHNVTPQNVTQQKVTSNKTSPHKTSPGTKCHQ
jgi:hypothetical protein